MKLFKSSFFYIAILAILFTFCADDVEGRRKVLMGRKTINRTYLRGNAVPAYVIVIIVGICQIITGAGIYLIMRKMIIQSPVTGVYAAAPTEA